MKIKRAHLIYNPDCDFCKNTASWFGEKLSDELNIVSNKTKKASLLIPRRMKKDIKKDVHLVISKREIYSRGDACYELIKMKYPTIGIFALIIRPVFRLGYIVLKKIKRYL